MSHPKLRKRLISWALVVIWTTIIFLTLPYAPIWRDWITDNFSGYAIPVSVVVILLVIAGFTIGNIIKRKAGIKSYFFFIITIALYVYSLSRIEILVEQVHFLEYGLLAYLIIRALRIESRDVWQYLNAVLLVSFIGVLDEYVQGLLVNRVCELRDIQINIISGLLAMIWHRFCLEPEEEHASPRTALLIGIPIAGAIIFSISLFNTVHSGFGHFIEEDDKVGFYSRSPAAELLSVPKDTALFRDKIVDMMLKMKYSELLKIVDPVHGEILVHVFRRDRYLFKQDYRTAYWENYILDKYFNSHIRGTKLELSENNRDIITASALIDTSGIYISPVSAHLVTAYSERQQWIFVIMSELILLISWIIIYRRKPGGKNG